MTLQQIGWRHVATVGLVVFQIGLACSAAAVWLQQRSNQRLLLVATQNLAGKVAEVAEDQLARASLGLRSPLQVGVLGTGLSTLLATVAALLARLRQRNNAHLAERTRLVTLLDHAGDAVVGLDEAGRVSLWNLAAAQLFDLPAGQALGQTLDGLQLNLPAVGGTEDEHLRQEAFAGCSVAPFETQRRHSSGRTLDVELSASPMYSAAGAVVGVALVMRPIAQRLAQRQELQSHRQSLELAVATALADRRTLLEALDRIAVVSVTDAEGRITEVNDLFCALSKHPREALLGQTHRIIGSDIQDTAFWRDMQATVVAGQLWQGEICHRASDGSRYWVQNVTVPFRNPAAAIDRYVSMGFDITLLKTTEQALRRGEAMLERTGRMARVGGWSLDLATNEMQWSAETCRIHGLQPGYRPTMDEAMHLYAPEVRPQIQAQVLQCVQERQPLDLELPLVRADGTRAWVRALGEAEFEGEQAVRLVGAFQDVSEDHATRQTLHQQQRMQVMLHASPMAVRVASLRDNRVQTVNDRFCRLVQLDREACMGLDVAPYYANAEAFASVRRRLAAGQTVQDELMELQLPDQPEAAHVWALATYTLIEYEGEAAVLAWHYDVTEMQQAREAARQSHELMLQALEATQTGLVIFGADDRLELCNGRFLQLYPEVAHHLVPGTPYVDAVRAISTDYRPVDENVDAETRVRHRAATFRQGGEWVRALADGRWPPSAGGRS